MDQFINIANTKVNKREDLFERRPDHFDEKKLRLEKSHKKLFFPEEMNSVEELYSALAEKRKRYLPFLTDHNPVEESGINSFPITEFKVEGKTVRLPDYGGPVGAAEKVSKRRFP